MSEDKPDLLTPDSQILEMVGESAVTTESELFELVKKLKVKMLERKPVPKVVMVGANQFRYILGKLEELETLKDSINKAREYWRQWAAMELRKALRNTEDGPLIDALECIRDNYRHEGQSSDHEEIQGQFDQRCRKCLAQEALARLLGDGGSKENGRDPQDQNRRRHRR